MTRSTVDSGAVTVSEARTTMVTAKLTECSHSHKTTPELVAKPKSVETLGTIAHFVREEDRRRSDKDLCNKLAAELSKGLNVSSPAELDEMCNNALRVQVEYHDEARAIELYEQVVDLDAKHVRALSCLGALYHKSGRLDEARKCYDCVLEQEPERYKTVYNLGRLAHDLGSHADAQKCYERALSLKCDDTIACNALAFLGLLHQDVHKDFDQAQSCYESSLERNPNHLRTLDHQCALMVLTGNRDEARAQHARIVKLDPGHSDHMCAYLNSLFNGELLDNACSSCKSGSNREWASWHGQPLSSPAFSSSFSVADPPAQLASVQRTKSHSFLNRVASKLKDMVPSRTDSEGSRARVGSFPFKSDKAVSNLDISTHSCSKVDLTSHGRMW